ncbi:MAG: fimbrillin family protein [Bacteroidaceae bacterium]|nr:fimbrillin family protein [Bacteroidaceae bacterium]
MNNLLTQKFPIAAFALLFVLTMSCSHEPAVNDSNNPNGSNVHEWEDSTIDGDATMTRMVFSVGDSINVVRQGQTRATTTVAGVTTFQVNDIVTIGVAGKSAKDYKITNTTSGALAYNGTATDAYCWQSTSETVSLRAWSYGNTTTNSGDPDNAVYTLPTDQSSNYEELLYAPATNYDYATYNSSIPITLYHQLARLVINLEHIKTGDLNVSEIYIGDGTDAVIPTTAKFHKPTSGNIGTWDNIGTEKGKITPKTETANACYSAVLIPGTYAANQKFMVIKTSDSRTYCYIPTSPIVLAAGNQYNYTISVKDLKEVSTLTIGNISAYTYDGTAKEPHPTVTDGSKTLTEGTDYTLSWSNNTNAGTATVTVTGMGGYYNGSQSKNFTINKATATITLSKSSVLVADVSSDTFIATLSGSDASTTITATTGNSNYYTSSAGSLSSSNSTITITGKADGVANCTISANSDNYTYTSVICAVTIRAQKKNPLWWLNKANEATTTNSYSSSSIGGRTEYYYNWFKAMQNWSNNQTPRTAWTAGNKSSTVSGATGKWHMGVLGEWNSVLPYQNIFAFTYTSGKYTPDFSADTHKYCFGYDSSSKTLKSETTRFYQLSGSSAKVVYAIRFIGTEYCSAWKWVIQDNGASSSSPRKLLIYSILIEKLNNVSAADSWSNTASNWQNIESIWSQMGENSENGLACRRSLVAAGYPYNGLYGVTGYYWPATGTTEGTEVYPTSITFGSGGIATYQTAWNQDEGRSVRTFHD